MNRLKLNTLIIAITACAFSIISSAQSNIIDSFDFQGNDKSLSIKDAVELVLKDSPDMAKRNNEIEKNKITIQNINYNVSRAIGHVDKGSIGYLNGVEKMQLQADYLEASGKRNYDAQVKKLASDVENAYYVELQDEENVKINKENLDVAKKNDEITKKKFDLGLVSKQDVLSSESNVLKAQDDLESSQNKLLKAKMSFNIQLNLNVMDNVKLTDQLKYEEFNPGKIADAVTSALSKRNELKGAEYQLKTQEIATEVERLTNDKSDNYANAKRDLEQGLRDYNNTLKNTELEVRSNYLDITEKKDAIVSGQKSVDLAQEALKIAQVSYDNGMNTITDLQKAQVALQQAKLGVSKAVLDYKLAILKYQDSIDVGRTVLSGDSTGSSAGAGSF